MEQFIMYMASPFFFQSLERYRRILLMCELGRSDEAIGWLSTFGRYMGFEYVYIALKHYQLGEICQNRGEPELAKEHYRRFVELWQDCDLNLRRRVDEAQRRIEQLGG